MNDPADPSFDPTLEADVFARHCASRPVLQDVASRWGVLAMAALREGPYRFSALRRRVDGISERMLSQTLQNLERDGMIHREVQQSIPPVVEYTLTPLGARVAEHLAGLIDLLESNIGEIREAQDSYHRE
ncbi:helix-turn-helix domain-containing protein [Nocardia sp. NPDC005978]|uniref:winged helix-turn-helix transcriptional regulator n=1 Tax=unclassified Nocardia TaxID=2637762 RepID=UPI0033A1D56A